MHSSMALHSAARTPRLARTTSGGRLGLVLLFAAGAEADALDHTDGNRVAGTCACAAKSLRLKLAGS
jgi:hypothetical protein